MDSMSRVGLIRSISAAMLVSVMCVCAACADGTSASGSNVRTTDAAQTTAQTAEVTDVTYDTTLEYEDTTTTGEGQTSPAPGSGSTITRHTASSGTTRSGQKPSASASATTGQTQASSDTPTKAPTTAAPTTQAEPKPSYDAFDLDQFTTPLWTGKTVYHESVGFVEDKNGNIVSGELLFKPDKIICVRTPDLGYVYQEGKDYTVSGKKIVLKKGGGIPVFSFAKYSPAYPSGAQTDWLVSASDPSRYIAVTGNVRNSQVMVTYTHSEPWSGFTPDAQMKKLPFSYQKLKNKQAMNIVFYGDSITAGYEASGVDELVIDKDTLKEWNFKSSKAPYTPSWAELVTRKLRNQYGYDGIRKINRGAGGSDSIWGKTNAAKLVNPENPDLVVLGYGMNEVGRSGAEFKANIRSIIETIHTAHPRAEFVLVSCMLPNRQAAAFAGEKLAEQEEALYALQREMTSVHIAVAPVNRMNRTLEDKGKVYTDYTGNNLNHPNDFLIRLYAQTILAALSL